MLDVYKRLRSDEMAALPQRMAAATAELTDAVERERELQQEYSQLVQELDDLRSGRVVSKPVPTTGNSDMDLND